MKNTIGGVGAMVSLWSNQSGGQVCGLMLSLAHHSASVVWYGMVWYGMVWYGITTQPSSLKRLLGLSESAWHPLSDAHPQFFSAWTLAKWNQEYQSQVRNGMTRKSSVTLDTPDAISCSPLSQAVSSAYSVCLSESAWYPLSNAHPQFPSSAFLSMNTC